MKWNQEAADAPELCLLKFSWQCFFFPCLRHLFRARIVILGKNALKWKWWHSGKWSPSVCHCSVFFLRKDWYSSLKCHSGIVMYQLISSGNGAVKMACHFEMCTKVFYSICRVNLVRKILFPFSFILWQLIIGISIVSAGWVSPLPFYWIYVCENPLTSWQCTCWTRE